MDSFPYVLTDKLLELNLGSNGAPSTNSAHDKLDQANSTLGQISSDTADIRPKIGAPVTTLAGDIAAAKAVVDSISTKVADIQNKINDGTIGLAAIQAAQTIAQTSLATIDSKIGTPGSSLTTLINAIQISANTANTGITAIQGTLGTPTNGSMSADVAQLLSMVGNIQNNTKLKVSISDQFEIPATSYRDYKIILSNYNTNGNAMEDLDSPPGVAAALFTGTSLTGNFVNDTGVAVTSMIRDGIGRYHVWYRLQSSQTVADAVFTFTCVEGGQTRTDDRIVRFVNEIVTSFTASDRTAILDIQTRIQEMQPKLGTPVTTVAGDIAAVQTTSNSIKSDTSSAVTSLGTVLADLTAMMNKTGSSGFVQTLHSLQAIRESIDSLAFSASAQGLMEAVKQSGLITAGNSETVVLSTSEGWTSIKAQLTMLWVVPTTNTSTNFEVSIFEDAAKTQELVRITKLNAGKNDLRLVGNLPPFVNKDSTPTNTLYLQIRNISDSVGSTFKVTARAEPRR